MEADFGVEGGTMAVVWGLCDPAVLAVFVRGAGQVTFDISATLCGGNGRHWSREAAIPDVAVPALDVGTRGQTYGYLQMKGGGGKPAAS